MKPTKRNRLRATRTLALIAVLVFSAGWVLAQTDEDRLTQFQFNFSPPGARANAMGRAFIGLANDGTAAITNPAGMVQLGATQIYIEYKHIDPEIDRLATVDSFFTGRPTTFGETSDILSFFNITQRLGKRVHAGFTIHRFIELEENFSLQARGVPELPESMFNPNADPNRFLAVFPSRGQVDLDGTSFSGSLALDVVPGKFSLGFTVSIERLEADTRETRFNFSTSTAPFNGVDPSNPSDIQVGSPTTRVTTDDDDTSVGFTVGALFRPKDGISAGWVYARGGSFDLRTNFEDFLTSSNDFSTTTTINVPDRVGGGVAISPTRLAGVTSYDLTLLFDVVHIRYSDLLDDFRPVLSANLSGSASPASADDFEIDDATEVHFGAEVGIPVRTSTVFLRGGAFTNPEHGQRFFGSTGSSSNDAFFRNLFRPIDDDTEVGFTVGGGVTLGNKVQVDVAYVDIDSFREFVASVAFFVR